MLYFLCEGDLTFVRTNKNGKVIRKNSSPTLSLKPKNIPKASSNADTAVHDLIKQGYQLAFKSMAMPEHANPFGTIFGGFILSEMMLGGSLVAEKKARSGKMRVSEVSQLKFKKAVKMGEILLVWCKFEEILEDHTCIKVHTKVFTEQLTEGMVTMVTEADIIYIHIDQQGQPCHFIGAMKAKL